MATPTEEGTGDKLSTRVLKRLNAFTELPVVYELSYVCFWGWQGLIGPVWALLLFAWWFIEGVTGKWWPHHHAPQPGQAVLITGCDTGFGNAAALRLAGERWAVYAGCLTEAGAAALAEEGRGRGNGRLVSFVMDVTKPEDVDRAVRRLEEDGVSLHALINNAGIGSGVPFDWASLDEYERCMQVNFISVVRLVKACLPLLKQSKGRIINLSSIAGLAAIPFESPYVASKHALEAFSTCIRAELQPFGIKVITCNPTPHETPINAAGLASFERAFQALSPGKREEYGQDYFDAVFKLGRTFFKGGWDPVHVVNRIVQATTLVDPMPQYLIGMDGRFALMPLVHNSPLNFQFVFVMNTFFRKLIPAAVRNKGQAPAAAAGGALLPTTAQPDDRSR